MHLRRRGNSVQIVKSQPGDGGKVVSRPIGSANLLTGEIGPNAMSALTSQEVQEVKDWIGRRQAVEAQRQEVEYRMLADRLTEIATWIQGADKKVLAEHADEVRESLGRVRLALGGALGDAKAARTAD
jgi:NTP pyrophosphatase (non-canonical NTP hydrolase)